MPTLPGPFGVAQHVAAAQTAGRGQRQHCRRELAVVSWAAEGTMRMQLSQRKRRLPQRTGCCVSRLSLMSVRAASLHGAATFQMPARGFRWARGRG